VICIWNGANFYFEIFSETYTKRIQRFLKEKIQESDIAQSKGRQEKISTSNANHNPNPTK
jgi:hypothetical protein